MFLISKDSPDQSDQHLYQHPAVEVNAEAEAARTEDEDRPDNFGVEGDYPCNSES